VTFPVVAGVGRVTDHAARRVSASTRSRGVRFGERRVRERIAGARVTDPERPARSRRPNRGETMHVLDHLTEEHRKAEQMLAQLAGSDAGAERDRVIGELEEALSVHMAVEEMFVYPVALEVLDAEDVREANNEHDLAREGLAKLRELAAEPGFGAAVDMLTAGIGHHVHEEESDLFPKLRTRAADELAGLEPEALEQEARRAGAGSEPTKEELYAQAQEVDLPGRSQMTKRELAEALRDA